MDQNYTHITMVVDRSGSMTAIKDDAEGGVNQFIEDQAGAPGRCTLTLTEFDDKYEPVYKAVDPGIAVPNAYKLVPRGRTAMNDAIGKAIVETGEYLKHKPEDERPGLVVFVIVTDGQENSSKEYTGEQIKQMIKKQEDEFSWNFTFLAANIDAFAAGEGLGVGGARVMSFAAHNVGVAYAMAGSSVTRARSATSRGLTADQVQASMAYTDEEREKTNG